MRIRSRVAHSHAATLFALAVLLAMAPDGQADRRPPWISNRVVGSPNPPAPLATERVFPRQRFENPVDLTRLPGTDRLLVAEQGGRIWSFPTTGAEGTTRDLALDVRKIHQPFARSP